METVQIPKYHLAPNFSLPPVDFGGELTLGSIIPSIQTADETIKVDCRVDFPSVKAVLSRKMGFAATSCSECRSDQEASVY